MNKVMPCYLHGQVTSAVMWITHLTLIEPPLNTLSSTTLYRITRHNKNAETVFIFIGKFSYLKYDRLFGPDLLRGFVAVLQVKTVLRAIISNLHFS